MKLNKDIDGLYYDGDFWYTITEKFRVHELVESQDEITAIESAIDLLQELDEKLMNHKDFEEM